MNQLKLAAPMMGENAEQLKREPVHSQQKIVFMAISLLIPVLLWLVQGTLFAHMVRNEPWRVAIGVGIACAFFIYWLDRMILTIPTLNGWVLKGRLILALCIAVIGGITMDLVLFNDDIERKIDRLYARQIDSLDHSFERTEVAQEQKLVDLQYAKQAEFDSLQRTYLAEIQGRGSKDGSGPGPISEAIISHLMDPAKAEVTRADAQVETYRQGREARRQATRQQAKRDNGLELRVHLLHSTVFNSWITTLLFLASSIGFFLMELLPLMAKMSLRQTALDVKREQEEARQKALASTWSRTRPHPDLLSSDN